MSSVLIETGICGDDQMTNFQNATLQGHGELVYSIATFVKIPDEVFTEQEAAEYLKDMMNVISEAIPSFTFEVQIGPDQYEPDESLDYDDDDEF